MVGVSGGKDTYDVSELVAALLYLATELQNERNELLQTLHDYDEDVWQELGEEYNRRLRKLFKEHPVLHAVNKEAQNAKRRAGK